MAATKDENKSDDRKVLINFKTTAGHRRDLRRLALDLDMTLTDLILAALEEYKKHNEPKD